MILIDEDREADAEARRRAQAEASGLDPDAGPVGSGGTPAWRRALALARQQGPAGQN